MSTMNRRLEIVDMLLVKRSTTANELAQILNVSIRTIQYDIRELSVRYPIYTKQGEHGGIFIDDEYRPYNNTLSEQELKLLHEFYEIAEGFNKQILYQIISKYGPVDFKI